MIINRNTVNHNNQSTNIYLPRNLELYAVLSLIVFFIYSGVIVALDAAGGQWEACVRVPSTNQRFGFSQLILAGFMA